MKNDTEIKKIVFLWITIFLLSSYALNQLTGYFFNKSPINILSLFIIPLLFSRHKNKEVKIGAIISLIPGLFLMILYYVVRPLL